MEAKEEASESWRITEGWEREGKRESERMHKHTSQLRGPSGPGSGHHVANRGPVRRWNSFHGGGSVGGGASNFNDTVGNGNLPSGMITKAPQEPFRAVPKAVQALRSESVDRSHRVQPPPPPAFPRRRFSVWWVWKFQSEIGILYGISVIFFSIMIYSLFFLINLLYLGNSVIIT